jgi:fatty acid desaturase
MTAAELQAARSKDRLNVRIDDEWYDLSNWRAAHPAGSHWIDAYKNSDGTEVMYGFHSDKAMNMIKRLPKSKAPPTDVPPPVASSYAFREWRQKLVDDGWFVPHWRGEVQKLLPWAASLAAAKYLSAFPGFLPALGAVFAFAVSNTLAGWLSHDYVHGRHPFNMAMRGFGELVGGRSTTWWSMKHNMHHALTNEIGYDEDVALEPAIYLWQPDPKKDSWLRNFQHIYWPIPFSVLFLYWRLDSIKYVLKHKKYNEAVRLALHWGAYSALLPFKTLMLGIWLSGLLTATIVTVTHQSEEIFINETLRKYDFTEAQFRSTRDAMMSNWFSDILWGGMQWQLEHHLFPTMPRYKYKALHPLLKEWAKKHDLEFRTSGEWEIMVQNVNQLKKLSTLPAVPGNPDSTPIFKQV